MGSQAGAWELEEKEYLVEERFIAIVKVFSVPGKLRQLSTGAGENKVIDQGMDLELALRLSLGKKAYHSDSAESYVTSKLKWLQKVAKRIILRIDELDTTTRHKQMLASEAERFLEKVNSSKVSAWEVCICSPPSLRASAWLRLPKWFYCPYPTFTTRAIHNIIPLISCRVAM